MAIFSKSPASVAFWLFHYLDISEIPVPRRSLCLLQSDAVLNTYPNMTELQHLPSLLYTTTAISCSVGPTSKLLTIFRSQRLTFWKLHWFTVPDWSTSSTISIIPRMHSASLLKYIFVLNLMHQRPFGKFLEAATFLLRYTAGFNYHNSKSVNFLSGK